MIFDFPIEKIEIKFKTTGSCVLKLTLNDQPIDLDDLIVIGKEKIQLYVANNGEPSREYFTCSDHDFITQTFIPEIKKQFKNTIENSNDNSNMISNPPPLPDTREHLNSINSKDKDKPKHEQ